MHSDLYEALGKLNRAISHVSNMADRHGDHDRLEPYIDAVEMATQRLWSEAQGQPYRQPLTELSGRGCS